MKQQLRSPDPFIPNLPDDRHCMQSTYTMVVQMLTGERISMSTSEHETGYIEGRGTWPFQSFLALANRGLCTVVDELFDAELFAKDARAALLKQNQNDQITEEMIATSDITLEMKRTSKCLINNQIHFTNSTPSLTSLKEALNLGAVVFAHVNSRVLNDKDGYIGHMVIVLGQVDDIIVLADPGLPAIEHSEHKIEQFCKAWEYPTREMANFIAAFPNEAKMQEYLKTRALS